MRLPAILLPLVLLSLAGCDSLPTRMQERFSPVPPKVQVFTGDQATVNAAAQKACQRLDLKITRSSPAGLEAVTRIKTSASLGDSRQLVLTLRLHEVSPGQTEAALSLVQQVESQSMGGTSQEQMREHSLFMIYFSALQQVLDEATVQSSANKN